MRAVALADESIQAHISENFIPLKIEMPKGTAEIPLSWPALRSWRMTHKVMGGQENRGFTFCSVVTPDLDMELANTGGANVWDLFRSTAYDRDKFLAMVQRGSARAVEREKVKTSSISGNFVNREYLSWKRKIAREIRIEGRGGLPPEGFDKEKAIELFKMTGDTK